MKKYLLLLFHFAPKKIGMTLCVTLCFVHCNYAQNPLVKVWDYRFGGTEQEQLTCFQQTSDKGCILGGFSLSDTGGNKTGLLKGNFDFWIVKLDSMGQKQWDKDFGGTYIDMLYSLQQTTDGGYILGGRSLSDSSGDKTQPTQGFYDYWIIKIDAAGNKQWDKDFGGTNEDGLYAVRQTIDGGFIIAGTSNSDSSGDKTQSCVGNSDYWIVKTDSLGNKQWDKDFGGADEDILRAIDLSSDGGYLLGGHSRSGISGDKTEDTWGDWDYWIIKVDALGNKEWDMDLGGTSYDYLCSVKQTADHGYTLGGISYSDVSGNKTQPVWGICDYWVVKIDSNGSIQWDKDFGGNWTEDEFGDVNQTDDSGYLIPGTSYSPVSGDKTENNLGIEQMWVVKTDSTGNLQWEKTIFTSGHDEFGYAIQTDDNCYIMATTSDGGVAGYKTEAAWNSSYDYWIIKFCDTVVVPNVGFTSDNAALCPGTCTYFVNLSSNAISYQWYFWGATPDTSTDINPTNICYANQGSYDITLIATNANGSDTLTLQNYITVFPQPPAQSISQSNDTLFAIAGSSSYQWYFNGNIITGATDYFYIAIASGDYNVIATDINGCEVEAVITDVLTHASLAIGFWPLAIYPNPVTETLEIRGLEINSTYEISIYNVVGEKVFSAVHCLPSTVDCLLFPAGLYYLEITSNKKIYRTKFVKQ